MQLSAGAENDDGPMFGRMNSIYLTFRDSFSALSKPILATKYSLELGSNLKKILRNEGTRTKNIPKTEQ